MIRDYLAPSRAIRERVDSIVGAWEAESRELEAQLDAKDKRIAELEAADEAARHDIEMLMTSRQQAFDERDALAELVREVVNDGQVGIRSESWYERARAALEGKP